MHKDRAPIRIMDPFVPDDRGEFVRLVSIGVDFLIDRRRFDLFERLSLTLIIFRFGVFFLPIVNRDPQSLEHMVDLPEEGREMCATNMQVDLRHISKCLVLPMHLHHVSLEDRRLKIDLYIR
jgi:hypothetical protein